MKADIINMIIAEWENSIVIYWLTAKLVGGGGRRDKVRERERKTE